MRTRAIERARDQDTVRENVRERETERQSVGERERESERERALTFPEIWKFSRGRRPQSGICDGLCHLCDGLAMCVQGKKTSKRPLTLTAKKKYIRRNIKVALEGVRSKLQVCANP